MANYYQILEVSQQASEQEIKRAFRRLAMQYHPDRNKDPQAPQRFIEIQTAYDLLIDPAERGHYDERLNAGLDFSFLSELVSDADPTVDPETGRRNYKYHRGKRKPPRDMDMPFDNFEERISPEFSLDFSTLGRVMILGMPGFMLSLFVAAAISAHNPSLNSGHYFVTVPFLIFHVFALLDCLWGTNNHYAMLMKVTTFQFSTWQDLSIRATATASDTTDYTELKSSEWYRDHLYVYAPSVDFSEVQQFFVKKSLLFKLKFGIEGIVKEELRPLPFNEFRQRTVAWASALHCAALWSLLWLEAFKGIAFLFLFVAQVLYICFFLSSNKVIQRRSWRGYF